MEDFVKTFHIDWKLMIAQIVNFGLVFLALYFLAAKPLKKLMADRTEEITTGLENAKEAKNALSNANVKKEEIIKEAKDDAKTILVSSQEDGKKIIKEAKDKSLIEKEEILRQAKLEADKEKRNIEEAIRKETANLVEEGVKKMVENYVEEGHGEDIIKAMLVKKS